MQSLDSLGTDRFGGTVEGKEGQRRGDLGAEGPNLCRSQQIEGPGAFF